MLPFHNEDVLIHLTTDLPFKEALLDLFVAEGFRPTRDLSKCQLALFVDNGQNLETFDVWVDQLDRKQRAQRWVCMPGLTSRQIRQLGRRFRVFTPQDVDFPGFKTRILAEIYAHLPMPQNPILVGRSKCMRDLRAEMDRFAPSDETILLWGESGSGKELCAIYLHQQRGKGKQVPVNCASIKPEMMESEMFGHIRGAFTGASASRKGMLLEAGQGTCFLDEIGELAYRAQGSLLRVLEERLVRPVGGNQATELKCRVIMATHRHLEAEVEKQVFRADLYHRISHLRIDLPPLRGHMEDVPMLVLYFLKEINKEKGTDIRPPQNFDPFFSYHWPGNVRELKGQLTRVLMGQKEGPLDARTIATQLLRTEQTQPKESVASIPFYKDKDNWEDLHKRTRKTFLENALMRTGGVNEALEALLGRKQSTIYQELKRLGIPTQPKKPTRDA